MPPLLSVSPARAERDPAPTERPLDPTAGPGVTSAVSPFVPAIESDHARALQCMTQAIYYEAATEPRVGQEAVAQVVLNRVRHPAFPKTVCGVVFEGSARSTGCQFTFTCDGSLTRRPVAWRWDEAKQVASEALDGRIESPIGASTHYHAAWMVPYWRASMVETARIGGHVFYHMAGPQGAGSYLTGNYSGDEPEPGRSLDPAGPIAVSGRLHSGGMRKAVETHGPQVFAVWGLEVATVSQKKGKLTIEGM